MEYILSLSQSIHFLKELSDNSQSGFMLETERHQVNILEKGGLLIAKFKLPWCLPQVKGKEHLLNMAEAELTTMLVLVQAGYAALAISVQGEIKEHKTIQKYMVRKKQGKAQITYLNKKGKSRAGSRIRLAETVEFFEEINQKMNEWLGEYPVNRILLSCSERLWGLLFQSKVETPFEKKDPRLLKVPVHVHRPKFTEIKRINYLSQQGNLQITASAGSQIQLPVSDNWIQVT